MCISSPIYFNLFIKIHPPAFGSIFRLANNFIKILMSIFLFCLTYLFKQFLSTFLFHSFTSYNKYGRNMVASPRKKKKPRTSVTVVTKTAEANAGSTCIFFNKSGTKYPAIVAATMFKNIATPQTKPKIIFP